MSVFKDLWRFPTNFFHKQLIIDCYSFSEQQVIETLLPFVSDERLSKLNEVISNRTLNLIPVMENLYDRGNISAVMRSAESFGFFQFCTVNSLQTDKQKYSRRTSRGAEKWCSVTEFSSSKECLTTLKNLGYKVYTTHLDHESVSVYDINFRKPSVVVFGNEKHGVSDEALDCADANIIVPMHGFTQSFNISVAAALSFQAIYQNRTKGEEKNGDLTDEDQKTLTANYILNGTSNAKRILTSKKY